MIIAYNTVHNLYGNLCLQRTLPFPLKQLTEADFWAPFKFPLLGLVSFSQRLICRSRKPPPKLSLDFTKEAKVTIYPIWVSSLSFIRIQSVCISNIFCGIVQVWSNSKEQSTVPLGGRGRSQWGRCSKMSTWLSAIALPHSPLLQTPIYPYLLQCVSLPDFTAFLLLLCQMSWELLKLQIMLWDRGLKRDRHFFCHPKVGIGSLSLPVEDSRGAGWLNQMRN